MIQCIRETLEGENSFFFFLFFFYKNFYKYESSD